MCNCNESGERWIVTLPNGLKITKPSEKAASVYAARHPGATYAKAS